MGKKIFLGLAIALLLFLFIVPSIFLNRLADRMQALSEETVECVHAENWEQAQNNMQMLHRHLKTHKELLKTFLHHSDVDEIDAAVRGCVHLAKVEDQAQFLLELELILNRIEYLRSVVGLNLYTIF